MAAVLTWSMPLRMPGGTWPTVPVAVAPPYVYQIQVGSDGKDSKPLVAASRTSCRGAGAVGGWVGGCKCGKGWAGVNEVGGGGQGGGGGAGMN